MLQAKINYPLVGQILHQRYQILQVLGSGAFGQAYIACDLLHPDQPKYAIKHYSLHNDYPHLVKISKRVFITEVQTLKTLGSHDRIPQFIDCFTENQGYYLVQELITGETLNDYLATLKHCDRDQREAEVIALLGDVLTILDFVHRQGTLHCDLKPSNLIRRKGDGRWVTIDFGNAQSVRWQPDERIPALSAKSTIAVSPSGYLSPELLVGRPYPNTDIYALGIIAIEALTGEDPGKLQLDLERGELGWSHLGENQADLMGCSEALEAVLRQMVRYNPQNRFQSAREVLQALEPLRRADAPAWLEPIEEPREDSLNSVVVPIPHEVEDLLALAASDPSAAAEEQETFFDPAVGPSSSLLPADRSRSRTVKLSTLGVLAGAGATLAAANAAAIGFGLYSLGDVGVEDPGTGLLAQAAEAYHRGNLDDAIALAKSVPADSIFYQDSQTAIQQWQKNWQQAAEQFQLVEQAYRQQDWDVVLARAQQIPPIGLWQQRLSPLVAQAQVQVETEAQSLLEKAFAQAQQKEFTRALGYLQRISPRTEIGTQIQPKIAEYRHKQNVRARVLLQQAYNYAQQRDFSSAMYFLGQIPPETQTGAIAQEKLVEYAQKQRIKENIEQANSAIALRFAPRRETPAAAIDPGSQLQEIHP